jgi:CheY-like chemotaxis protein
MTHGEPGDRAQPLIGVVNDDTVFLQLMDELLTEEGYSTFIHFVGSTAYDRIKEEQPDLVILDIRMEHPEAGWITLDLIRLDPVTRPIPVIVASADIAQLLHKEDILRRMNCTPLPKPFDLDILMETIQRIVGPPR